MNREWCLIRTSVLLICMTGLLSGCHSEEAGETGDFEGEGIAVESPWVRPGSEGRMSAGYFLITNFDREPDTLTGVSSDVAQLTEIHESYELEEGMMGMREVHQLEIPAGATIRFEPGGLHIMFIQLQRRLSEGDELELTLHFARQGDITLLIPVRS